MNTAALIFISAIAVLNLGSFLLVFIDKRKSIQGAQRVPEVSFFVWSIFFSALGVLAGMVMFRHKTRNLNFILGIGLLLLQQIALAYLLFLRLAE